MVFGMDDKLQITLAAELASLPIIREFVDQVCREAGIDGMACFDIKLAVEEACTNVIEHGKQDEEPGRLALSLQTDPGQLVVRLTDFGQPFEPSEPPAPSAEASLADGKVGGFGLYFIYGFMDVVSYESGAAGNTLTMIKHLNQELE